MITTNKTAQAAIKASLSGIDAPPKIWLNEREGIVTRLIQDKKSLRKDLEMLDLEIPIYEYATKHSYSLITSSRVISHREQKYKEFYLKDISQVRRYYYPQFSQYDQRWKTLRILNDNKDEFLLDFDIGLPCYFAKILILNLSFQIKLGRWYNNVGESKNGLDISESPTNN